MRWQSRLVGRHRFRSVIKSQSAVAAALCRRTPHVVHLDPRLRIVLVVATAFFVLLLLYPFETTTVPQWNLRVVDAAGTPVPEINVTEHWQNYLLESEGHEEVQTTNQDGRVSFVARSIRASLVRRLLARIGRFGSSANRARPIHYGAVVVWGSRSHETRVSIYQGEETPQAEIRVLRLPSF